MTFNSKAQQIRLWRQAICHKYSGFRDKSAATEPITTTQLNDDIENKLFAEIITKKNCAMIITPKRRFSDCPCKINLIATIIANR